MRAAETLLQHPSQGQIIIHTDSQAAVKALESPVFTSKTVLATSMALDDLALTCTTQLVLTWTRPITKKHIGIDSAIRLANHSTTLLPREEEPVIPTPKSFVKQYLHNALRQKWNARWMSASIGRQSRMFWPAIDEQRSILLLRSDRDEYGLFVRLFTGHNNLNRHRSLTGETDVDECRLCQEDEESSEHLLCNCIDIRIGRQKAIGHHILTKPSQLAQIPLDSTRRLILLIRQRLSEEGLDKI